jgi:hypothetical protein
MAWSKAADDEGLMRDWWKIGENQMRRVGQLAKDH